jgi:outer membrane protein OmpA-like peptidoglycan-associated protein
MNTKTPLLLLAAAAMLCGCATIAPNELVQAREGYRRASTGTAAKVVPAQVHVASEALEKAEQSFEKDGDTYRTRDLAYVAQRKAQLAEAQALTATQKASQSRANADYRTTQGEIVEQQKGELSDASDALAASERSGERTADQLAAEKKARADADRRAADALAKLAAVRDDDRGTVITLSGSVLFASGKATLLPDARVRLDQVADVLLENPERTLTIEGHTDSQGSDRHNSDLSQRRADAVRSALVAKGYPSERIEANGLGEGQPVADNASTEGRANNRRVEIVVARG